MATPYKHQVDFIIVRAGSAVIAPVGTADCLEVETLCSCLLAANPPSTMLRRTARSRLTA
jgi:hypothetical protein